MCLQPQQWFSLAKITEFTLGVLVKGFEMTGHLFTVIPSPKRGIFPQLKDAAVLIEPPLHPMRSYPLHGKDDKDRRPITKQAREEKPC